MQMPQQCWHTLGPTQEEVLLSEYSVDPTTRAGDPFHAAAQDHPHCCNDGWVTIGQVILDEETGEEREEYALYLCRRCADSR
jgi:hypothetical protein